MPVRIRAILSHSVSQPYPGVPILFHAANADVATHETFEIYRCFLYTGKLFSHDDEGDQDYADDGDEEAHEDREWVRLALAYFLGLKLGDEKFCNTVVDGIVEKMAEAVSRVSFPSNVRMMADILSLGPLSHWPRERSVHSYRARR